MTKKTVIAASLLALLAAVNVRASGPVGVYAIVERVIFEPDEQSPERLQIWGTFSFVELNRSANAYSTSSRYGYLYFTLPSSNAAAAKTEWTDLKSIAGTGQAVAFGRWGVVGALQGMESRTGPAGGPPYFLAPLPGNPRTDVRVRPASEPPANPAMYATDAGVVKRAAGGTHAQIVRQLKEALKGR
jgi:hypothetical protein